LGYAEGADRHPPNSVENDPEATSYFEYPKKQTQNLLGSWVYYSAQIFLLGAEFTKVYANRHGSKQGNPVSETESRGV
jgi:hypothetical protein